MGKRGERYLIQYMCDNINRVPLLVRELGLTNEPSRGYAVGMSFEKLEAHQRSARREVIPSPRPQLFLASRLNLEAGNLRL